MEIKIVTIISFSTHHLSNKFRPSNQKKIFLVQVDHRDLD